MLGVPSIDKHPFVKKKILRRQEGENSRASGPRAASWHPQARETDQSGGPTDQPAGQSGCGVPQGCPGNMITGWYAVVGRTWPSCRLAPRAGMVQLYDPLELIGTGEIY